MTCGTKPFDVDRPSHREGVSRFVCGRRACRKELRMLWVGFDEIQIIGSSMYSCGTSQGRIRPIDCVTASDEEMGYAETTSWEWSSPNLVQE